MKSLKLLLTIAAFFTVSYASQQPAPDPRLADVKKIFVEDLGRSDHAKRFRLVLEDQLEEKGFTIVHQASQADAILSGAFTLTIQNEREEIHTTLRLKLPAGERLWSGDYKPGFYLRGSRDWTKRVATSMADKLQRAYQAAVKKRGG